MRFLLDKMADGRSPCLLEYGLISLMTNELRVLGWITQAAQFSGRDAKIWYRLTCGDEIIVLTKAIIIVKDWIIMWKRLSWIQLDIMLRKAGEARANRRRRRYYLIVLLLPTVFTLACLPFEFDIAGYGAPHDGKVPRVSCTM